MIFKYLGGHKDMQAFGYDFSNGATPDVTDEKTIAKLQGNAEFEAVEVKTFGAPVKEKKQKAVEPVAAEVQAVDGQGDVVGGEVEGNLPGIE